MIAIKRDATWGYGTFNYFKDKYRKALSKWNKDTGGGDGTPASFENYCENDYFLAYIYLLDLPAGHLLASSITGAVPNHLRCESGGYSLEEAVLARDDVPATMKKQVQVQLNDLNDSRQQVQKLFGKFEELLDVKVKQQQQEQQQTKTQKIEDSPTTFDACLNKVTELERKQQMIARSSALSSSTKRSLSRAIAVNAEKYAKKAARLCSDLDTSSSRGTASVHHGVTSNKKKNTPPTITGSDSSGDTPTASYSSSDTPTSSDSSSDIPTATCSDSLSDYDTSSSGTS